MNLLFSWLLLSLAFWITAKVVPGFTLRSGVSAMVVAALFGLLNFVLGWLFFVVLGIATLGIGFLLAVITRWVVTAILLKITAGMTSRLEVRNFGTALIAALVIAVIGSAAEYAITHV